MPSIIGFDQEPGAPEGMGTFHFDDGRALYAHEPEMAKAVQQPMQLDPADFGVTPQEDQRTAQNAAPSVDEQLAQMSFQAPGQQPPPQAPPQSMIDTSGVSVAPQQPQQSQQPQAPPDPQAEAMKFITAPVKVAATKGGVIPKSQSLSVEQEGLPYDPALAEQRANANIDLMVAKRNTAETMAARSQAEFLHAQGQLPELQKKAAAAQTELAEQQTAYKTERAELDRLIAESQQNQKSFNANRWFESKNAIGKIGSVLAQAMGAYAATLGRGENWAQKIINQEIDADIANQRAQIDAGKGNVDNALMKMKLRFGDINQAEAALKIAMGKVADTQALAYAKSTGSQDIQNLWQEQVAQNEKERVAEEQKFMASAIGKRKTTTDAKVVQATAGGYRDPTTAEMSARADLAGKIPGIAEKSYDAELKRQKALGGGVDPEKKREDARNLVKDTAEIVKGQAEAQAGRDLVNKYQGAESIPGLGLASDAAAAVPFGIGQRVFGNEESRSNRAIINRTVLAYQHALTGAGASDNERKMLTDSILGSKTPQELAAAIRQADDALEARRKHIEAGYDPAVVETVRRRGGYETKVAPPTLQREEP